MSLKVSILGFGLSGRYFHAPLVKAISDFEVVAVASSRKEEVAQVFPQALSTTVDVAIEMADIVIVATPHSLHYEQAKKALEQRKHVVVEKPFTATVAQASELYTLAKQNNCVLAVFHNRRYDADFLTIKKMLEQDSLGDIVTIESHFDRFRPIPKTQAWREQVGEQSGVWWDLAPHLLDQAFCLFGKPKNIHVDVTIQRQALVDDFFDVSLIYDNGRRIRLTASCLARDFSFRFRVHGTKGSALFKCLDPQEAQLRAGMSALNSDYGFYPSESFEVSEDCQIELERGDYTQFYRSLRDSIVLGHEFPIKREEVLLTMEVLTNKTLI